MKSCLLARERQDDDHVLNQPHSSLTEHSGSDFGIMHTNPHGGVRPCHQKSTCLTQLTLGPDMVQIWSRYPQYFEATKPSKPTVWCGISSSGHTLGVVDCGEALGTGAFSFPQKKCCRVTEFAPHEAIKSIASAMAAARHSNAPLRRHIQTCVPATAVDEYDTHKTASSGFWPWLPNKTSSNLQGVPFFALQRAWGRPAPCPSTRWTTTLTSKVNLLPYN